jgi:hypothetical protein
MQPGAVHIFVAVVNRVKMLLVLVHFLFLLRMFDARRSKDKDSCTSVQLFLQPSVCPSVMLYTRESKKLSALLFFQFIYTKVGVEQVRHFSI